MASRFPGVRANARKPAQLPGLQASRAVDPAVRKEIDALREHVEVRLGSRGDLYERAVTFRDLDASLTKLVAELTALIEVGGTTTTSTTTTSTSTDLSAIQASIASINAQIAALSSATDPAVAGLIADVAVLAADVAAKGDFSSNTTASVDSEVVLFSGTGGKTGKRASGSGYARLASGVLAVDSLATVRSDLQGDGSAVDQVAFRGIPLTSRSADYTLVLADAGKGTLHPGADANARTMTIPANGSVAFPVGATHTFVNRTSQVVTISITTDTLLLAGTTTTGSRSLAQNGVATALKVESNVWIISGVGLT